MNGFIQSLVTILSISLAIVAWIAKIRWSKEFRETVNATMQEKDERIKAKDEELTRLNNLKEERIKGEKEKVLFFKEQLEIYEKKAPNDVVNHLNERNTYLENQNEALQEKIDDLELKLNQSSSIKAHLESEKETSWAQIFYDIDKIKEHQKRTLLVNIFIIIANLFRNHLIKKNGA